MIRVVCAALFVVSLVCPALGQDAKAQRKPTEANVPYGPDERNVLDFWKADGEGPRPLLVYIHGGGWTSGRSG